MIRVMGTTFCVSVRACTYLGLLIGAKGSGADVVIVVRDFRQTKLLHTAQMPSATLIVAEQILARYMHARTHIHIYIYICVHIYMHFHIFIIYNYKTEMLISFKNNYHIYI